jgi:CRISPR/Cas system-associated exonuclease Cas4 (RecB family)
MIRHISYSYLHVLSCPYAAFLRYEAALRGPTNEYLALGNALHLALELGHRIDRFDGPYAYSIFVKEYNRIIDDEEVFVGYPKKKKLEAEGAAMLSLYTAQVDSGIIPAVAFAHEKEFKLPYEGVQIVGRIDKIEKDDGGYSVIDYKSASREPDPWFLRHNIQLTAYAWACLELYGELPKRVGWHHLRNGKILYTERTQKDVDQLKQMISNAILMDKKGIRHRIFHEQICGWCDYAGDVCDDSELEERIVNERGRKHRGADSDRQDSSVL